MSSHFVCDTKAYSNELGYFAFDQKGLGYFATGHNSLDEFKAWIGSNPVTVICKLVTPIETALTDEEIAAYEALKSNNPTTTIFNDSGAGMNARYITKSHEPVFKKIFKKMSALEAAILSGLDEILAAQENLIEEG